MTSSSLFSSDNKGGGEDWTAVQALSLGDSLYVEESYDEAITAFTAAHAMMVETTKKDPTTTVLHFRILSHRSAAFYQLQRYSEALDDATQANALLSAATTSSLALEGLRPGETEWALRRQGMAAYHMEGDKNKKIALEAFEAARQLAQLNQRPSLEFYTEWIAKCTKPPSTNTTVSSSTTTTTTKTSGNAVPSSSPPQTAVPPPARSTSTTARRSGVPKYQYYQSDQIMTIAILEPSLTADQVSVDFGSQHLTVVLHNLAGEPQDSTTVIAGTLYASITPDLCKVKIRPEKVLLKLRKTKAMEWPELLTTTTTKTMDTSKPTASSSSASSTNQATPKTPPNPSPEPSVATKPAATPTPDASSSATDNATTPAPVPKQPAVARPYASHKDWDQIERDLAEQEAAEKPQGDEAMNQLFQQIYANADPDTRRAMIKSYQTSGGTVLSTNWQEVAAKDYEKERTAPKGMEWKTWEGDKLPMKKDED